MNLGDKHPIQGPSTRYQGREEYMRLQNAIEDESSVKCDVVVKPTQVEIRTKDWADLYLARSVIRQRTALNVVRAEA